MDADRPGAQRWVTIGEVRGAVQQVPDSGGRAMVTVHPSAVVRLRGRDGYREAFDALVADLRMASAAAR